MYQEIRIVWLQKRLLIIFEVAEYVKLRFCFTIYSGYSYKFDNNVIYGISAEIF